MLDDLAKKYGTDKSSLHHGFADIYESYLSSFKDSRISLIELGVGGYQFADRGGEGLRMWYDYFRQGKIIGIDLYPKEGIINNRTEFWQGSQIDRGLLQAIIEREAGAERRFVIDDASHNNLLTIETFNIVFPMLESGDLYFVEDIHSSYWEAIAVDGTDYGGKYEPGAVETTMRFFTDLTHQLNAEHLKQEYRNEYANMIEFIHFHKEMIVIKHI